MEALLILLALAILLLIIYKIYQEYNNLILNKANELFMSRKRELESILESRQKELEDKINAKKTVIPPQLKGDKSRHLQGSTMELLDRGYTA